MTPSERILTLAKLADELLDALDRAALLVEKAAENGELFKSHAEQLGHLQVNLRAEFLVKDWMRKRLEVHKLLLEYGKDRQTKNRLARDYQKKRRQKKGGEA